MKNYYWKRIILVVSIFGIAMAFVEVAIVIYLRTLFYSEGFSFPLKVIPTKILITEVIREAATIVMLVSIGWLAGRRFIERFAYFAFVFGIWDIFYYIFLKATLGWPMSLLNWDILFLIPLPWTGPVLAPILVSLCLVAASVIVLQRESTGKPVEIHTIQWIFIILGGIIIIISFLLNAESVIHQMKPVQYNWYLFTIGLIMGLFSFFRVLRR